MSEDERVRVWMSYAERDLEAAELLVAGGFCEQAGFSAQQAAEKALKALYIAIRGDLAPRTHRVDRLAKELGAPADLVDAAMDLTGDYATTRYPDVALAMPSQQYTKEIADLRLQQATAIVDWVRSRIRNA